MGLPKTIDGGNAHHDKVKDDHDNAADEHGENGQMENAMGLEHGVAHQHQHGIGRTKGMDRMGCSRTGVQTMEQQLSIGTS